MNIGQKITDGTCIWVLRHKGEMHNVGDIWMTKAAFNADGFMIHAITGLAMLDVHICDGTNGTVNMIDRFPAGTNVAASIGTTGGANSQVLTAAQMPAHGHTGTTAVAGWHGHAASAWTDGQGDHQHGVLEYAGFGNIAVHIRSGGDPNSAGGITWNAGSHGHNVGVSIGGEGNHQHAITTANAGGNAAFDNRPAYVALAFVQKIY